MTVSTCVSSVVLFHSLSDPPPYPYPYPPHPTPLHTTTTTTHTHTVSIKGLIAEFKGMQLLDVDARGRDSNDRHYFGLVRSTVISVRRMMAWCDHYDARSSSRDTKKMAIGLLMTMSMLDRTRTPTSLFNDHFLHDYDEAEHGEWMNCITPPKPLLLTCHC